MRHYISYVDRWGLVHTATSVEPTTHCGVPKDWLTLSSTKEASCLHCHGVVLAREQMPEWLDNLKKEYGDIFGR